MKRRHTVAGPVQGRFRIRIGHSTLPISRCSVRLGVGVLAVVILSTLVACKSDPASNTDRRGSATNPKAALDSAKIIERFRAVNTTDRSTVKMKVKIQDTDQPPREVRLTTYRNRKPDGGQVMLIEFTAPTEERDRSSLIEISPQGDIEATRYAQSANSFVTAKGATTEDSLFGVSLQELVEGQPEKYDFTVVGEEALKSSPVYRLEGKLKERAESRFPRLVLLILKEDAATTLAEFYDSQNTLARRMEVETFEQISGHPVRSRFTIDNIAKRKKLDFELLSASFEPLSDSLFTREHLKAITMK
jgi:hypothetical protein